MNILQYKQYDAAAEFDPARNVWLCKILFIDDVVLFEAVSDQEIQNTFETAVDDDLDTCKELGKTPEQPVPRRPARTVIA